MSALEYLNVAPNNSVLNPLNVSASAASILITPANIANLSIEQLIRTVSPTLYPTVGSTYQINMSFTVDWDFPAAPNGQVAIGLGYWNGTSNILKSLDGSYFQNDPTSGYGTVSLTFTHTSASNTVRLVVTNLSNQNITGASSAILIQSFTVSEISSNAGTLTSAVLT